jgi:hypothetical protein
VRPWVGADPSEWNLVTAANSSAETYVESQAAPVAAAQTYSRAALNAFFAHISVGYSDRVALQVAAGGVYDDPIMMEIQRGTADLMKKVEDTLVGTTQDQGIQSIIDGGDTYAGLAPGSVTAHASKETSVGGALGLDDLEDLAEALSQTPYISQPTDILAAQNQITNYGRLVGPAATTSLMRWTGQPGGGGVDAGNIGPGGYLQGQVSWNGLPWTGISGLTNTVILMLDMTSGVELLVRKDITVVPLAQTSHDTNVLIDFGCALKVARRNAHGKLTGVTA